VRRLALAATAAAAVASGCGGGAGAAGHHPIAAAVGVARASGLTWAEPPVVFAPEGLPHDRILAGRLRNDSARPVDLRVDRVTVLDAKNHHLRSNVRFVEAYGHGLYGPGGPPAPLRASQYDQQRLGEHVTLQPGAERPVTLAWRLPSGSGRAARVRVGAYVLTIPRR
jgi:hypothetical protein